MQLGISAVKHGNMSIRKAAAKIGVPSSSLFYRLIGKSNIKDRPKIYKSESCSSMAGRQSKMELENLAAKGVSIEEASSKLGLSNGAVQSLYERLVNCL